VVFDRAALDARGCVMAAFIYTGKVIHPSGTNQAGGGLWLQGSPADASDEQPWFLWR